MVGVGSRDSLHSLPAFLFLYNILHCQTTNTTISFINYESKRISSVFKNRHSTSQSQCSELSAYSTMVTPKQDIFLLLSILILYCFYTIPYFNSNLLPQRDSNRCSITYTACIWNTNCIFTNDIICYPDIITRSVHYNGSISTTTNITVPKASWCLCLNPFNVK